MKYLFAYFNEQSQKLRFAKSKANEFNDQFIFIGPITPGERDFYVEILADRFGDKDITTNQIIRYYKELKKFCERVKKITID